MAVDLPALAREEVARVAEAVRPAAPGARWVPAENLHLTLAFLGEVDEAGLAGISDALGSAVAGLVDFPVHLDGIGAFPSSRRARVLWVGLADPAGGLRILAAAVADGLARIGFPREAREFAAHVTLARLAKPARVEIPAVDVAPMRFVVDRVSLVESHLGRPAPRYEVRALFPFRRRPGPPRDG